MKVSSKPSSSSSSSSSHKTSSSTKSKSTSSVKSTSKPVSKPAGQVSKPKDSVSLSKDVSLKSNGNVPNFGSWAMAAPQAPQATAKPAPADPAPRVTPAPAAPAAPPEPKVGEKAPAAAPAAPPLPGKEVGDHPAPNSKAGLAKGFDDAGWATAQARHTAEVAEKAGGALKAQPVANAGSSALRPLNPAASVMGGVAFGKMAYDSAKEGHYTEAALQAGNSAALTTLAGSGLKGMEVAGKVAGRAAPALGGALQAYEGIKKGDTFDTVSGGAKLAGAAMIATGFGAPVGSALILGSYMADLGRWGYQKWMQ